MGALSNTSSLLSTYSSPNKDRQQTYFRNGESSNNSGNGRYVVGSVGKACGKHVKRAAPKHPNVAIATQVLNPSAIGGSLKNRRFVEHFGPSEKDDEVGFLSHKRRSKCGKVCCYGLSIAVTVLMMTGLVLAVGYMQSEKQKVSTRPVKLAQGQSFKDQPFVSTSTTQAPATLPLPTIVSPSKGSLEETNDDDMDEISLGDYVDDEDMQNLDQISAENQATVTKSVETSHEKKSDSEDSELRGEDFESDDFDSTSSNGNSDIESYDSKNDIHDDLYSTAVKVLPPADFKFEGISFEFPIYRSKNDSKSGTKPVINYGSVNEEEETKELEKSINDVNSNFTSLNDSVEDNMVLSHPTTTEEDYANAHSNSNSQNNNNQPDSLSLPSHSHLENEPTSLSADSTKGSFTPHLSVSDNEQSENENKNKNHFNFEILSSTAKLETDIFDDDEDENDDEAFETSASDQTKKGSENVENSKRPPPPRPSQQNNRYRIKSKDNRRGPKPSSIDHEDNEDYESETERPRTRPRKLVLKTKGHRKMKLSKATDKGPEPVKPPPTEHPMSHTLPILEYKADFSNIKIPSDSSQPPKLEFQFPAQGNQENVPNPISDFKFTFTTPSTPVTTDVKFDFKEFMNNQNSLNANTKNEFNFANFSPTPVSVSSTDFSIPQVQAFTPNPIPNYLTQGGGGLSSSSQQQDNQFSKRTFSNYDIDPSGSSTLNSFANTNSNPFAHLLGPQPQSGSIGSATPTGATLNLFQPNQGQHSQSYNFDTASATNQGGSYNFPSGTVPVDLSASHISVNGYGSSGPSYSVTDPNGAYSVTSLNSDLPYPNIGLNSPAASTSNLGSNQGNSFSFQNYGPSAAYGSGNKGGVEILTTGQGQVPTYNTITQGIHLLSLLSGNAPQNQNPFLNNDQYSSASSYQPQQYEIATKPQLQIAGLTGYGGSSNDFLQGLESKWRTPENAEQNFGSIGNGFQTYTPNQFENNYAHDISPRNNYRSLAGESDQLPSASFSKSIIMKLASPDYARNLKPSGPVGPESEDSKVSKSPPLLKSVKSELAGKNSPPRSLSVSILPNAVGSDSLFDQFIKTSQQPSGGVSLTPQDSLVPKSRKRDQPGQPSQNFADTNSDLDTAGSEINIVTTNRPVKHSSNLSHLSKSKSHSVGRNSTKSDDPPIEKVAGRGLRPGFYI